MLLYHYDDNYEKEMKRDEVGGLCWPVFVEDWNNRTIKPYNVFLHGSFWLELNKMKEEKEKAFRVWKKEHEGKYDEIDRKEWEETYKNGVFKTALKDKAMYHFWAKSEWEIILTSWPPYIENEEFTRLKSEYENVDETHRPRYRTNVNLTISEKIDVYDQLLIHWDTFVDYVWEHLPSIGKRVYSWENTETVKEE